ncbi:hypothetical protein ABW21_db0208688 [Orbilia brochopaga]|nr:hypothetical protein ABW21_db0208688 [Drechslerella brochopaga]
MSRQDASSSSIHPPSITESLHGPLHRRNFSSSQEAAAVTEKEDFQATGKSAVDMAQFLTGHIHRPGLLLDTNLMHLIFEGDKISGWFDRVRKYSSKLATTRVSVREYAASPKIMGKYEFGEVLEMFEQHKIEIVGESCATAESLALSHKIMETNEINESTPRKTST